MTGPKNVSDSAGRDRDVLIIQSEDVSGPDVVQRRPAIELTEGWNRLLENQGITRMDQSDDLSIVKARYGLDKRFCIAGMEISSSGREKLTRKRALNRIKTLMKNSEAKIGDT